MMAWIDSLAFPEPWIDLRRPRDLLQIDSHEDEPGMMWGDVGRLYFWIREDDLVLRKWGATWMVLQCG